MTNQRAIIALSNRPCASQCEEETMMKSKFLALVMLASAAAVSSTSAFACNMSRRATSRLMHRSNFCTLVDHVVGAGDECRRQVERPCRLRVNDQLELVGLVE